MSDATQLQQIAERRRSIYALNDHLPVSRDEVIKTIEHIVLHTPSAFNSQSTRLVMLFGDEHKKLWQITEDALRDIVNDEEKFQSTQAKMNGFKAAAGTVLFFEDRQVVKGLQDKFPTYADNFPVWAEHADAMHQYALWTTLAAMNIGANLQHYGGVIDEQVQKNWHIDPSWKMVAQMVFGGIAQPAGEKTFAPLESRLKVYGN